MHQTHQTMHTVRKSHHNRMTRVSIFTNDGSAQGVCCCKQVYPKSTSLGIGSCGRRVRMYNFKLYSTTMSLGVARSELSGLVCPKWHIYLIMRSRHADKLLPSMTEQVGQSPNPSLRTRPSAEHHTVYAHRRWNRQHR